MIKSFLKKIFKKIYILGKIEFELEESSKPNVSSFEMLATIHEEANVREAKIYNRFKNRLKIKVGKKTQIRGEIEVSHLLSEILIGDYSYIGPGTRIYCTEKISIGNRVLISHNVNIYDNNSHPLNSKLRHEDFLFIFENGFQDNINVKAQGITIHDDVWIGFNCIILKGVTIGQGAVIGAGTIITEDVPAFAVVVGNPPRIVKYTS